MLLYRWVACHLKIIYRVSLCLVLLTINHNFNIWQVLSCLPGLHFLLLLFVVVYVCVFFFVCLFVFCYVLT